MSDEPETNTPAAVVTETPTEPVTEPVTDTTVLDEPAHDEPAALPALVHGVIVRDNAAVDGVSSGPFGHMDAVVGTGGADAATDAAATPAPGGTEAAAAAIATGTLVVEPAGVVDATTGDEVDPATVPANTTVDPVLPDTADDAHTTLTETPAIEPDIVTPAGTPVASEPAE